MYGAKMKTFAVIFPCDFNRLLKRDGLLNAGG